MLNKIRELCKQNNISLSDLEEKAGLSRKTIFTWDRVMPSVDKVARVAKELNTTVEELLEG